MDLLRDIGYLVINGFICYLPSRKLRIFLYFFLSRGRISLRSSVGFNVKFLDIRNVFIGDHSNIGFGSIIDGRGAIVKIDKNVDIAPQVNIWTLQHDLNCKKHSSVAGSVWLSNYVWVGNRATILPGSELGVASTIGAGTVFKGTLSSGDVAVGPQFRILDRAKNERSNYVLRSVRRFR